MSGKLESLPDISSTQPDRLIKYRISENGLEGEVLLPGFWYTDFDKKIGGKLTVWAVAKLYEAIRYSVLLHGFGQYNRLKDEDHSIFMAGVTYNLSRRLHSIIAKSHWGPSLPLLSKLYMVHIGNTSFTFKSDLFDHKTGELLIGGYLTFVHIDYRTRRPAPFPAWMESMKSATKSGLMPERITPPDIPQTAFRYCTKAFASDIDNNGHVNQSNFMKWCGDAGTDAALKGHYSGFTQDIGKYPGKQLALRYIGEGMQGDQFIVYTWQDEKDLLVLHFVITKHGKNVFVARFTYYSNDIQPKL